MRVVIVLATVAVTMCCFFTTRGINPDVRHYHCDPGSHSVASDAEKVSNSVLDYVRDHAADSGYNVQKKETVGDDTYYGQAACDGNISQDDCKRCAELAYDAVLELCDISVNGAFVKLDSCRIRFASYSFDPNY